MGILRHFAPLAIALVMLAGCGGNTSAVRAANPTAQPSASPSMPSSPTPAATTPAPSPTPAWTPCDLTRGPYDGGCETSYLADSCDASHYSNTVGSLLDAYIESKHEVKPERLKDCPQFLPTWNKALTGFHDGSQQVGADVKPGTYETTAHLINGQVRDCYWERGGANGNIIANNFVTAATKVRVTIQAGDQMFTSRGCGNWIRV